jgi:DNA polymerase-3 subunit beta
MNIVIERKKLLESITRVHAIVEKRNIMPILEHVKIDISHSSISFTTTDLDITLQDTFNIEFDSEISFTVAVQPLYDITKKLNTNNVIEFDLSLVDDGKIEISAGHSKITIPCLSSHEFPSFETLTDCNAFEVVSGDLRKLFLKTKHAMASGDMRYYLNGININTNDDNTLTAAATDVHRLAMSSITAPENLEIPGGVIIPKKTVSEIVKLTEQLDDKEKLTIHMTENRISLKVHNTTLVSKLINGKYPNYNSIFAIKPNKRFSVDVKELSNAIELVSAIADGKIKIISLSLVGNILTVSSDNTKDGKASRASQEIFVESQFIDEFDNVVEEPDEEMSISFLLNAKYPLDVLSVCNGPRIHFKMSSATAPIIVKDMADPNSTYVLMPMQIEVNN